MGSVKVENTNHSRRAGQGQIIENIAHRQLKQKKRA